MNTPFVSIIIPLYNAENFISDTIHSALNQTYKNIEIIVVDDHSTDKSYQLVSELKNERIMLVRNPQKGACAARNYGFKLSKGAFVQYLDADDLISPNKIEEQVKLLQQQQQLNALASCGWGRFKDKADNIAIKVQTINKNYATPYMWLVDAWLNREMGLVSNWLTPRELIKKAGPWNEELLINQDGEFFCRIILNAKKILYSEKAFTYYRLNPQSITQSVKTPEKISSQLFSYQLCEKHLQPFFNEPMVKKAIGNLYIKFIYHYFDQDPVIVKKAWVAFYALQIGKPWSIGGKPIKMLVCLLGWKKALTLRKFLKSI